MTFNLESESLSSFFLLDTRSCKFSCDSLLISSFASFNFFANLSASYSSLLAGHRGTSKYIRIKIHMTRKARRTFPQRTQYQYLSVDWSQRHTVLLALNGSSG